MEKLLTRVISETTRELVAAMGPPAAMVRLSSTEGNIIHAANLTERLRSLNYMKESLLAVDALDSIYVGYPDGDYFLLRRVRSSEDLEIFKAPEESKWIVQSVERTDEGKEEIREFLYFSDNLNILARQDYVGSKSFDPRLRPWYQQAVESSNVVRSDPYVFFTSKKIGLTFARSAGTAPGVVVGADIRLENMSPLLRQFHITPRCELAIFDGAGNLVGYGDPERLVVDFVDLAGNKKVKQNHLSNIESLSLASMAEVWRNHGTAGLDNVRFLVGGEAWIGNIAKLDLMLGKPLYMGIVIPNSDLFKEVESMRRYSILITIFVLLITIPLTVMVALLVSQPLKKLAEEVESVRRFDFSGKSEVHSVVSEVDGLAKAMDFMKKTIYEFLFLIDSLNKEKNFDSLLERISSEAKAAAGADGVCTYLFDEEKGLLQPGVYCDAKQCAWNTELPSFNLDDSNPLVAALKDNSVGHWHIKPNNSGGMEFLIGDNEDGVTLWCLPLEDRQNSSMGVVVLIYNGSPDQIKVEHFADRLIFVRRLSGLAGVSLETKQLIKSQKDLFDAFIKLIAGAIDAKSPYTGGHCQRVPEITKMLARVACDTKEGVFAGFDLTEDQWEELHVAAWLHDCGKVTTPEFVVDKATKLETIYDRIHEVRMRFEVLKRDAEIGCWQGISAGGDKDSLLADLAEKLDSLDNDFSFIAQCNEGGEFMNPDSIDRLHVIAGYSWQRTLDDRIGISWEEGKRKARKTAQEVPVMERLLSDCEEHLILRNEADHIPEDNPWGFKLDEPEYLYNRGEVYNLQVERGTLSTEERFKINDHVVQTIKMLEVLPYPKHLANVPEIAGGHHETMIGTGYPRRLTGDQMSTTARMMVIADVFEALTASDRPYKKAKKLSEAIQIMSFMHKDGHFDSDLYELFLTAGVYKEYGEKYLDSEQIDEVQVEKYL